MQLSFESPRNGWLPVTISIAQTQFQFKASNVTDDVVSALVGVSYWLSENESRSNSTVGSNRRTVHFWREPLWNSIAFDRASGSGNVAVSYFHEHESASLLKATPDDLILLAPHRCHQCHRHVLSNTISHAVVELFHETSLYDYYEHWGHPPAHDTFRAIRCVLRSQGLSE